MCKGIATNLGANMLFKLLSTRGAGRGRQLSPANNGIGICCSTTRHRLTDSARSRLRRRRAVGAGLPRPHSEEYHSMPGGTRSARQQHRIQATPISGARAAMPGAPGEEVFYCLDDKLEDNTTPSSDLNHAFPPENSISYTGNYQSQVHWK